MEEDKSYFYLYRISYMWYCPLGFLLAIIIGAVVSWIMKWIFRENLPEVDLALLSPIVANQIQKRREKDKYRNTIKFG